jgi:cation-transporting ATPase E
VAPPNEWWAVVEPTEHDWRPTILAAAMVPLYIAILALPWTRDLFDVELIGGLNYTRIVIAVVIWTLVLREVWKRQIFERLFGYG